MARFPRGPSTMISGHQYVRSSPVPLAVASGDDFRILAASPTFARAAGAAPAELEGRPLPELFADAGAVQDRMEAVRSGRQDPSAGAATSRTGESLVLTIWRLARDPTLSDGAGEPGLGILAAAAAGSDAGGAGADAALAGTLREVNEALLLKALREEAQAREAQAESEAKSVFLASVSHELRTPLNSIIGYADLLDAGVPEALPDALRSHVRRIRTASRHLLSLIEQIIEASRAEFEGEVREDRIDLVPLLGELADLVRPQAADKGLRVEARLGEEQIHITGDRKKLRQVVLNLLVNAIKFTDQGHVRLELETGPGRVLIRVADTGIGIRPDDQARVFERFWQVDASSVRTTGGMGIGLWVVRTLVEAMGGSITLASAPDAGSMFEVVLPR